jgi:magnesium transporter
LNANSQKFDYILVNWTVVRGHMQKTKKLFSNIRHHIKSVIHETDQNGAELWKRFLHQHPADIAELICRIGERQQIDLFEKLPNTLASTVFPELPEAIQEHIVIHVDPEEMTAILKKISADELLDLFDALPDEEIKQYLKLLQKKQRSKIISLLHFKQGSAGRILNSDVLSLQRDFSIKNSILLLQKNGDQKDVLHRIYVTNREGVLVGYVNVEDLVINKPETPLTRIIHQNELTIDVHEDQEDVGRQMEHYGLVSAPVIDQHGRFLGAITADEILTILEEEANEDVYKMSGISNLEHSYFQTPFTSLIRQRIGWLAGLLLFQSVSSFILIQYDALINQHLLIPLFLTMLIGTGGNAGNQSATLIIRGLATGEITQINALRAFFREFSMSIIMAFILSIVSFGRVFIFYGDTLGAFAVSLSLFIIVIASVVFGALMPIILKRLRLDPAHSAAPFISTSMDIIGVLIYCFVCSKIL